MNVIKLMAELEANFGLEDFYVISVWPILNEITLATTN